jgi:beta-glucosidase
MERLEFPKGFFWGSATSSHQVEGGNINDWSEWEKSPARLDHLKNKEHKFANFVSERSCDSYNRYEEDFNIAAELGQNMHRFSIEWSRIEPEEGRFDASEMQHYIDVVKALKARNIEPMVTLWHFTNPIWLAERGGVLNNRFPYYFLRYAVYVFENLKPYVKYWATFNEPDVYIGNSYIAGKWPPQKNGYFDAYNASKNFIKAHIQTYSRIKGTSHNIMLGIVINQAFNVVGKGIIQSIKGRLFNYFRNLYLIKKINPHFDFIGLNYYHVDRRTSGTFDILPKQDFMPDLPWETYPQGIYFLLKKLWVRYKKPIFITENGIADHYDVKRAKFIKEHLYWTLKAINEGIDVRGYLYWSLLDNFEWAYGYSPRFGLVEINRDTLERKIRPSALEYAKICKSNTLEIGQ